MFRLTNALAPASVSNPCAKPQGRKLFTRTARRADGLDAELLNVGSRSRGRSARLRLHGRLGRVEGSCLRGDVRRRLQSAFYHDSLDDHAAVDLHGPSEVLAEVLSG